MGFLKNYQRFVILQLVTILAVSCAQVSSTNVACSQITPSFCLIKQQLTVNDVEKLSFTAVPSPLLVTHFEMLSPAQVKHIPTTIFSQFTELQSAELKEVGLESLEQSDFQNAKHLSNLILKSNLLSAIENSTFALASELETLALSENRINELHDEAFKGLTKLITLKLNNNQISVIKPKTFIGLDSLEYLHLYKNKIESIESGALSLPMLKEAFFGFNKLKMLPDDLFALAPMLELTEFTDNELTTIGEAFANCPRLSYINLGNNDQLKDANLLKFARIPSLRTLSLNNTGLKDVEDMSTVALANSQLQSLNLEYNHLSDPAILRYLSVFKELRRVYLGNNPNLSLDKTGDAKKYLPKLENPSLV